MTQPKVALVTGGASGMGRIMAKRLADGGTRVAIFDLNEAGLAETVKHAPDLISAYSCNVANEEEVNARVAEVIAALGPIDRLVHAAAIMPSRALVNQSPADVKKLTDIVYGGTVNLVNAVLHDMLRRDAGEIVAFGSIAGKAPVPKMGAYCAAKAAVNSYMEILINELAHSNVNIHLILPPAVNTPLVDQALQTDAVKSIAEAKNSGRLADPEKIIDAIDKGIAKGKTLIYPGEARFLGFWHELAPRLWWKVVMNFEKGEFEKTTAERLARQS